MLTYDYLCEKCQIIFEITHSMTDESKQLCEECGTKLDKQVSGGAYVIMGGINGSVADYKQSEHTKKVKDPERAVKMRKKAFGKDAVGDPGMVSNARHMIKGRTLGGAQKEVDKKEFIQAAAKDPMIVAKAREALKKSERKK